VYRRFDFSALPPSRRREALDVAARHGPFEGGTRSACRWQGGIAHVWTPRDPLDLPDDADLIAESSLVPAPADADAVRLLALRDGVEGQVWDAGVLGASRWWPQPPSADAWSRFLRAAGRPADAAVPPVQALAADAEPWGEAHERLAWRPARIEAFAWRATAVVVALVLGWQLAALATWSIAPALQTARLDALRGDAAPLIAARERAEGAQQRLAGLAALVDGPSDLQLMADVRTALGAEARVVGWARDGGRLRIDLQGVGADPRPVVQAFAGHPRLAAVVANPAEAGRMQLDIELPAVVAEAP
jgi:hypothetical protein